MKRMSWVLPLVVIMPLWGESIRIAQIDISALLPKQKVGLYVNVTDEQGNLVKGLTADRFSVRESPDGQHFTPVRGKVQLESRTNYLDGINLLLVIDNSGSMYRTIDGRRTTAQDSMRITFVRRAVEDFLGSVTNPSDKIGLVSYNSFYTAHTGPTTDKGRIRDLLKTIEQPTGDDRFTELYSSLYLAVDEFRNTKGRKVIMLLSDGENGAYFTNTGKAHPQLGEKVYIHDEPIAYCQQEGISVFTINFGRIGERGDRNLTKIAAATGGERFDAHNEAELSEIYHAIMEQILNEYLLTYTANMDPSDKRYVRLNYSGDESAEVTRFYFAGTVLGEPLARLPWWLVLPMIAAFGGLWMLSRAKFDRRQPGPSLEVLKTQIGKVKTQVVALQGNRTVIGRAGSADMTIVGNPQIAESHATIVYDDKQKNYTLIADAPVLVNNRKVATKILEPGDVINIGGTLTVFDEGLGGAD